MMIRMDCENVDIYIIMAPKVSVQVGKRVVVVCVVARSVGRRIRRETKVYKGGVAFSFFLSSIFRIIKPIYNDIPFPSTFQKSISGVF